MSRIVSVRCAIVSVPIRRAIRGPIVTLESIENVVVRVDTDDGAVGWSYVYFPDRSRAEVVKRMVEDLRGEAIGEDPGRYQYVWAKMWNRSNFLGQRGVTLFGIAAIDMAIWDVFCKEIGQPLYRLLGGYRERVPCYSSELLEADSSSTAVELACEAEALVRAGYRGLKLRLGVRPLSEDIERVAAVREAVGPGVELMADAGQRWTLQQALRMVRDLASFNLAWLEDPVPQEQVDDLARVAEASGIPIASGHNDFGRYSFRRLIEMRAIDILLFDIARVGGITEFLRIAALAAVYDVPMSSHVYPDVSIHLMAAAPTGLSCEHIEGWQPPSRVTMRPVDGYASPSTQPGIGLDFDLDAPSFKDLN